MFGKRLLEKLSDLNGFTFLTKASELCVLAVIMIFFQNAVMAVTTIPGLIEAEDYNTGGESVGYHDLTAGNSGGQYRADDVDIQVCSEGGFNITDARTGEWLAYDIYAAQSGLYDITLRVASQYSTRRMYIQIDGVNVSGTVGFNSTGSSQTYKDITVEDIYIAAGNHVMKIFFSDWYISLNYIDVDTAASSAVMQVPGRIEAEDFRRGREGVGYHDLTSANSYYEDRMTDVDIQACPEGGYTVVTQGGEWLAYEVNISSPGYYRLTERVASGYDGRQLHITVDDVNVTGTVTFNSTGGSQTYADAVQEDIYLTAGPHVLKIFLDQWNINLNYIDVIATCTGILVPGRIEAEDYNSGGEGVGYHDLTPGNSGGQYRSDDVDIQTCSEGGYNISDIRTGEWLAYDMHTYESRLYDITLRVASQYSGRRLHIEIDGVNVTGQIGFNATGGNQTFRDMVAEDIYIEAGNHVIKVVFDDWYISLNRIDVSVAAADVAIAVPGRIEAEDFRRGREGVGYHDLTAGNGYYEDRMTDVDIQACAEGGYTVVTQGGEWLAYEINVAEAGSYQLVARVATSYDNRQIHITLDGVNVTGTMTFNSTGGSQVFANVASSPIYISEGFHVIKIFFDQWSINLNYIDILSASNTYIVENGTARAEIIISGTAPSSVELAAGELQSYIRRITGDSATLPIVTSPTQGVPVKVYVGRSSYTDSLGVADTGLQNGGFRMQSGADWLVLLGDDGEFEPTEPYAHNSGDRARAEADWDAITGKYFGLPFQSLYKNYNSTLDIWTADGRGTLNAVCEFLRNLGVRWYYPGSIGEILPQTGNIALPMVSRTVNPEFAMREWLQGSAQRFNSANDNEIKWQMRLGLNDAIDILGSPRGHGIGYVTMRDEYKTAHPDHFAYYNGTRLTTWGDGMGIPCLTSTGLFNENLDFARKMLDHYDQVAVNVSPSDGFGYPAYGTGYMCQGVPGVCACAGVARPERGPLGALSDHVFDYVNRIAQAVYISHPDKMITTLAYASHLLPPEDIEEMSPNVIVILCRHRSDFDNPDTEAEFQQITNDWLAKLPSGQLYIWDYYLQANPDNTRFLGLPVYFPHVIANDLRFLKGKSGGDFIEVYRSYPQADLDLALAANHLNMYVTSRLYWGTEQDVDTMLREYYAKFYGPAAAQMREFVEYAEAHWYAAADPESPPAIKSNTINELKQKIQAAQTAAGSTGIYRERVDLLYDFLYQ